ncbi:hypothetical protein, partial [Gemmatimonas sp.]|uniref:hypothetical protein n=1 Tax=Gemmatimonas sp. TaxID=1962908 RepID=UPI00286C5B10
VTALLDGRSSALRASPSYAVGELPLGFPSALVPSGPVHIVGGMAMGDDMVAIFADSTRRLAAAFEDVFAGAGYTRPVARQGAGFSSGSGSSAVFCSDSATVFAEPLLRTNRALTRVTYSRLRNGVSCTGLVIERPDPSALALPELLPLAGTYVRSSRGGSGGGSVESEAQMSGTALVPSVILAHYAAQLVAAHWIAAAPAVSERVAAQHFEAKGEMGAVWEGVLMAVGNDRALTLSLQMRQRRATP